jgi:hypothetical protein
MDNEKLSPLTKEIIKFYGFTMFEVHEEQSYDGNMILTLRTKIPLNYHSMMKILDHNTVADVVKNHFHDIEKSGFAEEIGLDLKKAQEELKDAKRYKDFLVTFRNLMREEIKDDAQSR